MAIFKLLLSFLLLIFLFVYALAFDSILPLLFVSLFLTVFFTYAAAHQYVKDGEGWVLPLLMFHAKCCGIFAVVSALLAYGFLLSVGGTVQQAGWFLLLHFMGFVVASGVAGLPVMLVCMMLVALVVRRPQVRHS